MAPSIGHIPAEAAAQFGDKTALICPDKTLTFNELNRLSNCFANALASFAYLFAPASIILAALRASAALFALLSGRFYFGERNFREHILLPLLLLSGLFLPTLQ